MLVMPISTSEQEMILVLLSSYQFANSPTGGFLQTCIDFKSTVFIVFFFVLLLLFFFNPEIIFSSDFFLFFFSSFFFRKKSKQQICTHTKKSCWILLEEGKLNAWLTFFLKLCWGGHTDLFIIHTINCSSMLDCRTVEMNSTVLSWVSVAVV